MHEHVWYIECTMRAVRLIVQYNIFLEACKHEINVLVIIQKK